VAPPDSSVVKYLNTGSTLILSIITHSNFLNGSPFWITLQYSQRHSVINHVSLISTHLGGLDISFVLLNISSKLPAITQTAYQNNWIDKTDQQIYQYH
jgi:hypothetical protein